MDDQLKLLAERFNLQKEFAAGYSPLYSRLFGCVAGWLAGPTAPEDPIVTWLLVAARQRETLDTALLLAAGLHRLVLAAEPAAAGLAQFFPTVGGERDHAEPDFEAILRSTISKNHENLADFIARGNVQTNETGRGLCWVLPLSIIPWDAFQLIDLGCSAGLNLVADKRAYRLVDEGDGSTLLDLGGAPPTQFVTRCRGNLNAFCCVETHDIPAIVRRIGGDQAPFPLRTADDERTLKSYIWGDQNERMARLSEGMDALRDVNQGAAPVMLRHLFMPEGLDEFLQAQSAFLEQKPVVIYNTFMTEYLSDKGTSLRGRIAAWAEERRQPVLWIQWEPPVDWDEAPAYGWCAWMLDLWQNGRDTHWQLGWVHPHGKEVEFGSGLDEWTAFCGDAAG